jgi:uncharacterized protein YggE
MKSLASTLVILTFSTLAVAQQVPSVAALPNTIFVNAEGKFEAPPDTAIVQFNVGVQEDTSRAAYDRASKAVEQVRELLRSNGLDPKLAQVGFLSVAPVYDYRTPKRKLIAYRVSTSVELKLKDFSKVAPIVQQLADLDITQNQSLNYTLEDMDAAKNSAVNDAFRRARNEASSLAQSAGRALGDLSYASVDTYEQVRVLAGPRMKAMTAGVEAAAPPPTAEFTPQTVLVTARVSALFGIK